PLGDRSSAKDSLTERQCRGVSRATRQQRIRYDGEKVFGDSFTRVRFSTAAYHDNVRAPTGPTASIRIRLSMSELTQLARSSLRERARHGIAHSLGRRPRTQGEWKDVHVRERQPFDERHRARVVVVGLAGKTRDDIGAEAEDSDTLNEPLHGAS